MLAAEPGGAVPVVIKQSVACDGTTPLVLPSIQTLNVFQMSGLASVREAVRLE